jgi:hypothetical protein
MKIDYGDLQRAMREALYSDPPSRWGLFRDRWSDRLRRAREAWLVLKGDLDPRYPDGG